MEVPSGTRWPALTQRDSWIRFPAVPVLGQPEASRARPGTRYGHLLQGQACCKASMTSFAKSSFIRSGRRSM
jgi:hypothetical protein